MVYKNEGIHSMYLSVVASILLATASPVLASVTAQDIEDIFSGRASTNQASNNGVKPDIALLGQRYNEEPFSAQIVGEVSNNGTATAEFVQATISFYDAGGQIVGTETGYSDPTTVEPGSKAPFTA
jgi:hypothetical protein